MAQVAVVRQGHQVVGLETPVTNLRAVVAAVDQLRVGRLIETAEPADPV